MSTIAKQELAPYSGAGEGRVHVDGPQFLLRPNDAQVVAIILHELATNAAKYGALSVPNGQVHLQWLHRADGQLVLTWTEMGGPTVRAPSRQGFGSRIISQLIDQQQGQTQFDWRPEGLVCAIVLQTRAARGGNCLP